MNKESFNTNISHQLFDYKITNSEHENTNSKGDFVHITVFETFVLKISSTQKINLTPIWNDKLN